MRNRVMFLVAMPLVFVLTGCFGRWTGKEAQPESGHTASSSVISSAMQPSFSISDGDDLKAACLAARGKEIDYALAALGEAADCRVVRSDSKNDDTYYYIWTKDPSFRKGGNPFFGILGVVRGGVVQSFAAGGTCVADDGNTVLCSSEAKPYIEALRRLKDPKETLGAELDEKLQRFVDADVSVAAGIFGDPVNAESFAKKGKDPSWINVLNGQNAVITMKTYKGCIVSVRRRGALLPAMHFLRLMNAVTLVPLDAVKQGKKKA